MIPINVAEYSKYALSLLFILVLYVSYLLVKPLLLTIITAIILVYVFSPLYNLLHKRITNKYVCSLLVLVLLFLLLSIPLVFVLNTLSKQGYEQYVLLKQLLSDPTLLECPEGDATDFCTVYTSFLGREEQTVLREFFKDALIGIGQKIWTGTFSMLATLPNKILDFFIMIFLMFFLFADGKKLFETVRNFFPMKIEHENYLLNTLKETTDAVVFGQVFIAVLEGAAAALGFWLFGISHALLLGVLITFLGVIPFLGPTLVWVPLALYFVIAGIETGETGMLVKGLLLIGYGALVLSTIENLLKPKIIGDRAKLHPALVFLGVIGGLSLFGFIGFFLGPIILAVFATLIKIYEKEKMRQLKKG